MIVIDASAIPLPGKQAEHVAALKEHVAYLEQRWPLSPPRMLIVDLLDGRTHLISLRASLAEHEPVLAEQMADAGFRAQGQKLAALIVPGNHRYNYCRVV